MLEKTNQQPKGDVHTFHQVLAGIVAIAFTAAVVAVIGAAAWLVWEGALWLTR